MARRKCKAVSQLRKLKSSHQQFKQATLEQLADHQDRLDNLLSCHRFIDQAVLALTEPERFEEFDDWHFGLFLSQQWMNQQAQELNEELRVIKQGIRR